MKVYVAAPWINKDEARAAAERLEAAGHTITKRWWEHREVPGYLTDDHSNDAELTQQAIEDVDGVLASHVFVLLNLGKSEGKAVETGIAIMQNLPIFVIGGKSNLFHYFPGVREVDTLDDVIAALGSTDAAAA